MDLNITHLVSVVTALSELPLMQHASHDTGPASLSVLQLNRSELIHMRHVMVKIELDGREVDSVVGRVEAGRVCVVCTRQESQSLHTILSNSNWF